MSYKGSAFHHISMVLASMVLAAACLVAGIGVARAGDTAAVPSMVEKNALLNTIYRSDPGKALGLAAEIERQIAALSDSTKGGDGAAPRRRYRGPMTRSAPEDEEDILKGNRKDFQANPALKRLYQYSPLASLRMLERLREVAAKLKK